MLNPIEMFKRSILHLNRDCNHCYGYLSNRAAEEVRQVEDVNVLV